MQSPIFGQLSLCITPVHGLRFKEMIAYAIKKTFIDRLGTRERGISRHKSIVAGQSKISMGTSKDRFHINIEIDAKNLWQRHPVVREGVGQHHTWV
jgi:hypothetical protein